MNVLSVNRFENKYLISDEQAIVLKKRKRTIVGILTTRATIFNSVALSAIIWKLR